MRHVDPWSVLKFSLLLYFAVFVILLSAGVLLWLVANAAGAVDNLEQFIEELFAFESFQFEAGQILRATILLGLVLVIVGTAANVLFVVLFNLISDVVGGVRVTVIEEDAPRAVPVEGGGRFGPSSGL